MGQPDRRIDVFIEKAERWQDELRALRAILLSSPLDEAFKWRQPVYTLQDANVAILWAFKDNVGVGFFKGALLDDPEGRLTAPGENSRAARKMAFTDLGSIHAEEGTLRAFINAAIGIERKGLKVDMPKDDLEPPEELTAALDADPALAEAFAKLTPGRRRGYFLHIGDAKKPETRAARVEKLAPRIHAGKGFNER